MPVIQKLRAFLCDESRYIDRILIERDDMKKFLKFLGDLFSDSNKASTKRFIGILALVMFIAYGVRGLFLSFKDPVAVYVLQYWIFYVSLSSITMWIAFKFMSSDKALKYNILGQLAKFNIKEAVQDVINSEKMLDDAVQPSETTIGASGNTGSSDTNNGKSVPGTFEQPSEEENIEQPLNS